MTRLRRLRALAFIIGAVLVISMIGCTSDDDDAGSIVGPPPSTFPLLTINDVTPPEGCQSIEIRLEATQRDTGDFQTVSLQRNRPITISADASFGRVFDFGQSLNIRIEVIEIQGACDVFKVGKAWDFQGIPARQSSDRYSVSFQQFTADPRGGELMLKDVPISDECQSVDIHLKITQGKSFIELVPMPLQADRSLTQFQAPVDPVVAGEVLRKLLGLPPNIDIVLAGLGRFEVGVEGQTFDFGTFKITGVFTVTGRIQNGIGDFDFGNTFNFHEPLQIRIEVTDTRGECNTFKTGQAWEFEGIPMNDGDDKYSVGFPQFDEVQ